MTKRLRISKPYDIISTKDRSLLESRRILILIIRLWVPWTIIMTVTECIKTWLISPSHFYCSIFNIRMNLASCLWKISIALNKSISFIFSNLHLLCLQHHHLSKLLYYSLYIFISGYCVPKDSLHRICATIRVESMLHTLVRGKSS